ncbi:MAG: cupin domain-containing protein [Candidatus Kapaibacterium sp.]|jgi:quercetin dioxygenase-like cupin family protein
MESDIKAGRKGLVASQATKLDTLIDYQDGTIVSREILKKPTGKVTLFAFSEGEGLSEHTSPYDALVYVMEGKTEVTIAGEKYEVSAGEIILIPANNPHALKSISSFKMMLIMI